MSFDQQRARPEGQDVDEAVAVGLRDGRIHDHRQFDAVRLRSLDLQSEEFLPAELQPLPRRAPASIDDAGGRDDLPVGELDMVGRNAADIGSGSRFVTQGCRDPFVQPL